MSEKAKKFTALFVPVFIVVVLDQSTKYVVRTNSSLHYYEVVEGWLALNFTKNPGMALGMDWLSTPVISVIAILATIAIVGYILFSINKANLTYLICMGLIIGGAIGNIIDRMTMGIVGGYGGVLDGHVVDFIHFTLRINDWPVFPYIFNVADVAISTSIIILILFHKKIMPLPEDEEYDSSIGTDRSGTAEFKISENEKSNSGESKPENSVVNNDDKSSSSRVQ